MHDCIKRADANTRVLTVLTFHGAELTMCPKDASQSLPCTPAGRVECRDISDWFNVWKNTDASVFVLQQPGVPVNDLIKLTTTALACITML